MASTNLKDQQSNVVVGLGTWTYNVLAAGPYRLIVQSTENPPSSLIVTINQNGSPVSPSPTPAPTTAQQIVDVQALLNCALNDVITVVLSSAATIDNALNTVKTIINIHAGL